MFEILGMRRIQRIHGPHATDIKYNSFIRDEFWARGEPRLNVVYTYFHFHFHFHVENSRWKGIT